MNACCIGLLSFACLALPTAAQWSDDPLQNTPVAVSAGEHHLARVAVTPDGMTWVAWYERVASNDDVRVQLLDQAGVPLLPAGGLLVSDYTSGGIFQLGLDLVAASDGSCVLVFSDWRAGSDLDVFAYRIDGAGDQLWGPDGVTLSQAGVFQPEYGARVVETSQGDFAFSWSRHPSSGTGSLQMQVLDPGGAKQLGPDGVSLAGGLDEHPGRCEIVATPDGGWILAWVRDADLFSSLLQLRALRYAADGSPLWPATVKVTTSAPVHSGTWPRLASDGAGGAVLAWYGWTNGKLGVRAQRLDPQGLELYPHEGSLASLELQVLETWPALDFDAETGEATVYFARSNFNATLFGLSAQRFSASGARLWGDSGKVLKPLDGYEEFEVHCVPFGDGACVFLMENELPPVAQARLFAMRVDAQGDPVWNPASRLLSGTGTWKTELAVGVDQAGMGVAVWTDDWGGAYDLFAQNVHPDGSLGQVSGCSVSIYCLGAPNSVGNGAKLGASGAASVGFGDFTLEASAAPPGNLGVFVMGDTQAQTPFGDGTLCVGGNVLRFLPPSVIAPAGTAAHALDFDTFPADQIAPGSTWNFQFWYRDPSGPLGTGFNLSDALSVSFCP